MFLTVKIKFEKFYRKTPVLETTFNKVVGLKAWNFIKKVSSTCVKLLRTHFFTKHFWWLLLEGVGETKFHNFKPWRCKNLWSKCLEVAHWLKNISVFCGNFRLFWVFQITLFCCRGKILRRIWIYFYLARIFVGWNTARPAS